MHLSWHASIIKDTVTFIGKDPKEYFPPRLFFKRSFTTSIKSFVVDAQWQTGCLVVCKHLSFLVPQ